MNTDSIEICPICIENQATYFTECNHGYCIDCLCRITNCALCRNLLQRAKICSQIRKNRIDQPNGSVDVPRIDDDVFWSTYTARFLGGLGGLTYSA